MPSRRLFVQAPTAAVGAAYASGYAEAATDRVEYIPPHATLTYDESWLRTYQPAFDMQQTDREKLLGVYAWRATSTEFDTDVGVYWASYSHQEGASSLDSHYGDHEPALVFVDSETGDVQTVIASVYHWLRGKAPASAVSMADEDTVALRVISPWHHYSATDAPADASKRTLKKLGDEAGLRDSANTEFEDWLANGLEESLAPGVVVNPWRMLSRGHWWRNSVGGISVNELYYSALETAGIGRSGSLEA